LGVTSAQRGFLVAGTTIPFTYGDAELGWGDGEWAGDQFQSGQSLDDFVQQIVAGITGLPGDLVRPRYQQEPPDLPPIGTDWCAVGVFGDARPSGYPYGVEDSLPAGQGSQDRADFEEFDVLASFYGPDADRYATLLRQGLFVANNQEPLYLAKVALVGTGPRRRMTDLIQRKFMERYDVLVTFTRTVLTSYPVLYFLSATNVVATDTGFVTSNAE
jgi:hypothetical protein